MMSDNMPDTPETEWTMPDTTETESAMAIAGRLVLALALATMHRSPDAPIILAHLKMVFPKLSEQDRRLVSLFTLYFGMEPIQ
jgi:hypothetical protein